MKYFLSCAYSATASIGYGHYQLRKAAQSSNVNPSLQLEKWQEHGISCQSVFSWPLKLCLAGKFQYQILGAPHCKFVAHTTSPEKRIETVLFKASIELLGTLVLGRWGRKDPLATSVTVRLWWCGPSLVAWLGGAHTDSRFRRCLGGHIDI
ncbi:unnamed protein product [Cylindrotheca closterium]|uniref:Uncharacterized protein n=1 Tax=Cylindrotheca closterium TaxID=2856 RepID=A0AAD2FNH8_9STRA|nr:unnamed protein product [Cylindrotheca closterium]